MADLRITDMDDGTTISGGELFETVQSGSTKKLSHSDLTASPIYPISPATYTLVIADAGRTVTCANATSTVINIPVASLVPFKVGTRITLRQVSAGPMLISGDVGVTLQHPASTTPDTDEAYKQIHIHKVANNTWHLSGDLSAV